MIRSVQRFIALSSDLTEQFGAQNRGVSWTEHFSANESIMYKSLPTVNQMWSLPVHKFYSLTKVSVAPNDGFLSDPLKRYFRLSGVPLKLCRFILGCAIIFLSVRSF